MIEHRPLLPHPLAPWVWRPGLRLAAIVLMLAGTAWAVWSWAVPGGPQLPGGFRNDAAPRGIVSLELAWSDDRANEILESWDRQTLRRARKALYVDFAFIVLYSTVWALAAISAATEWDEAGRPRAARLGVAVAWAMWGAGLIDMAENVGMLKMLNDALARQPVRGDLVPVLTTVAAVAKFVLLAAGSVYGASGLVARFRGRSDGPTDPRW